MVIRGDAQAAGKGRFKTGVVQPGLDLRATTKGHHQAHTQAAEQGNVVDDIDEVPVLDGIARHGQHNGSAAMSIDVRR